jgi:hypothetical protein
MRPSGFVLLALLVPSLAAAQPAAPADTLTPVQQIRADAKALAPQMPSTLARRFLAAAEALPAIAPRTMVRDSAGRNWWNEAQAASLPDTQRARLVTRTLDERFYYNTRYGSPLAYARALEVLARHGLEDVAGKRIADFGYGTIGHLRLLASLGADVTGIEVDPLLPAFYSQPGDTGRVAGVGGGRDGRVRLVHGQWPATDAIVAQVGEGYDLFLSKNTLKRGYIHPEREVNPRMLVHLGVGDTAYVRSLARMLKPGGLALIYNLSPAPAPPDKPYIPWADGRSPFARELFEREGFEVLAFDADDSAAARAMGAALGWNQGPSPMDLETNLFGHYTLLRKRR